MNLISPRRVSQRILTLCLSVFFLIFIGPQIAFSEEDGMGAVDYNDKTENSKESLPEKHTRPKVGRKAAEKYMAKSPEERESRRPSSISKESHYMAVHIGTFIGDDSYKWGSEHESNIGKLNIGVTYRIGEWANAADLDFRADFSTFNMAAGSASKLSLIPVVIFPDASSHFPLYFGAGAGPGFYLKQISGQSQISFDYQLFLGARFFNILESTGFFVEAGIKNHFHLLSNGQYDGSFIAAGALFTF